MPRNRLVAAAAALALVGAGAAAHAQTTVDVSASVSSGSRTLYVEDMAGDPLASVDFGAARSAPFRVRVVDSEFGRSGFSVSATMTNLYKDNSGSLDYNTKIASSQVSLGRQTNPLNILNVAAKVQPTVDTVSTIVDTTVCNTLGVVVTLLANGSNGCLLNTSNLTGLVQSVNVPVNLSNLTNLPLLPQANDQGAFTNAEYGAGTAGASDPARSGAPAATALKVLSGSVVADSTVLNGLHGALGTALGTAVSTSDVLANLQSQYPTTWGLLTQAQIDTIVASTAATIDALTAGQVLSQAGTYMSLPTLNVSVPASTTAGDYRGTLVVTALQ